MTGEEVEKEHENLKEIVQMLETLIVTQETPYSVHMERLNGLRQVFAALTRLRDLQLEAAEAQTEVVEQK